MRYTVYLKNLSISNSAVEFSHPMGQKIAFYNIMTSLYQRTRSNTLSFHKEWVKNILLFKKIYKQLYDHWYDDAFHKEMFI